MWFVATSVTRGIGGLLQLLRHRLITPGRIRLMRKRTRARLVLASMEMWQSALRQCM
jgi:hypothetical protein